MILYSKTLLSFLEILNTEVKKILTLEMGLRVNRTRFHWDKYLIPYQIVVFEEPGKLGYFDSNFYRIGVHKDFLLRSLGEEEKNLKNLLRHELAHFAQFLTFGNNIKPHGSEFRDICKTYGWGADVWLAKEKLKPLTEISSSKKNRSLIEKVSKLLKLASSDNIHEAESAALKANEILLKYNLNRLQVEADESSVEIVLNKAIEFKRKNGKISAITRILETFFVDVVLNYGSQIAYMEIMGERVNVEIACYVADFLNHELERLWIEARVENPTLKGQSQKNSFMKGVARGFLEKQKIRRDVLNLDEKAMIRVHLSLIKPAKNWFYRNLGASSTPSEGSGISKAMGEKKGRELSINPAIRSTDQTRLITHV